MNMTRSLATAAILATSLASSFTYAQSAPNYCGPTTAIADSTAAASFTAFGGNERLEVRSGRLNAADWEWGLGTNTQSASSFQNINNINWPNGNTGGLPINFTLTYNADGSGVITLFDNATNAQLATKTFAAPAAPATGLRVGNAIRLWVKSNAGIGIGAKIKGTITEVDGVALGAPIALETAGDNNYSEQATVIALAAPANTGTMTVKGNMLLGWTGAASAIPTGSRLNAAINAGTITCGSGGAPQSQAITNFTSTPSSPVTYAAAPNNTLTLSATGGGSGNPVTFASTTPSVCTTGGTNGATVTILSAGNCAVTVDQAGTTTGNPTYNAAPQVTQSITVNKAAQAITGFNPASPLSYQSSPNNTFTLTATGGGSSSPVIFASTSPVVCTTGGTNGATVTILAIGTCTLTANQASDTNYTAASEVLASVTINKATQTITGFTPATPITYTATAPGNTITLTANASSGLPVTFASTSPSICTTSGANGASLTIVAAGTCSLTADQAGDATTQAAAQVTASIIINKATQTITGFMPPSTLSQAQGTTIGLTAVGGASGNTVTFASTTPTSCTTGGSNGATLTVQGSGNCSVTANQAGSDNYLAAPAVTVTISITVPAQLYFIHPDHLGTPRAITKSTDNTKVWEWKNDDPFGNNAPDENPNSANGTAAFKYNLRFPGQYFDEETNTHYNYFRDYEPATGRYIESDPIGLKGGINTYGYGFQSPLKLIDPQGLAVDYKGSITTAGATLGLGGQLAFFKFESECKCNKKVVMRGFASFLTYGAGANLRGVGNFLKDASGTNGEVTMTDAWADCPEAGAANGPAWTSGVNSVIGAGASFLTRWNLGRLRMYALVDGPSYGFDMSVTATLWGQSAVTSSETKCCNSN
jgi:RHS repeat-associated protein